MLVFIEGPSKVGKTSLGKIISEAFEIPFWTRPEEIEGPKEKMNIYDLFVLDEISILNKIDWSKNDLIVDRDPLVSETVYSQLKGRNSLVYPNSFETPNSVYIYIRDRDAIEGDLYDGIMKDISKKKTILILNKKEPKNLKVTKSLSFLKELLEEK